jgi:ABC-type oligopeptide transport system ATPase subunit
MNIAENILKHGLRNVYFLVGTSCGGKTTMAKEISKKYGFIHFHDNHHEEHFRIWQSICNKKYQPFATKQMQMAWTDLETHFSRSVEEFIDDDIIITEYVQFVIIELIKLSQNKKVISDSSWIPIDLLCEISEYNKIACLLAPAELIIRDFYGRDDHKDFLERIMPLKEPEKKLKTQNELHRIHAKQIFDDVDKYNLFKIVRNDESTVENTLKMLENHFNL